MTPTPSSEQSVYFDAPIAIFSSKSQPKTTTMNTTAPNDPHMPQPSHATPPNGYLGLNHNAYDNSTQNNTTYNRNVASPLSGGVGGESILSNHPYSPPPQGMGNSLPAGATTQHPAAESAGWLPAVDEPLLTASQHAQANGQGYQGGSTNYQGAVYGAGLNRSNTGPSRTLSRGSAYYSGAQSLKRGGSTHSRKSFFTDADGAPVHGSMFIGGAATTGPKSIAERDPELLARSQSADEKLTPKQRQKAQKAEAKENKRLSKVIKQEGKVEKIALGTAIKELANLQKIQNEAVKNEAKANAMHAKILADFQKEESVFLAARTRFEAAQARLHTQTENVEIVRNNAREATEQLQEKSREIDGLRAMLLLDEKERTVKLNELKMKEAAKNNSKPAKATSTPPPRLATPTPASQ